MSEKFLKDQATRAKEREARFLEIGNKFNNLMLQFKALQGYDTVSYICSLMGTPSVATVYDLFLEKPHFLTYAQIWDKAHLHDRTVQRAIKRLERFGVIVRSDEDPEVWSLVLENWDEHR